MVPLLKICVDSFVFENERTREEVRDDLRLRLCGVLASMIVREDFLKIDGNAKKC